MKTCGSGSSCIIMIDGMNNLIAVANCTELRHVENVFICNVSTALFFACPQSRSCWVPFCFKFEKVSLISFEIGRLMHPLTILWECTFGAQGAAAYNAGRIVKLLNKILVFSMMTSGNLPNFCCGIASKFSIKSSFD